MTPGHWGVMKTTVSNPSDQDREALSIVYFDADPGLQFGRRVWLPANSRRAVWIPVLIPENIIPENIIPENIIPDEQQRGEYVTAIANVMLLDESGDKERILTPDWRQLAIRSNFFVDKTGEPITVQITGESNSPAPVVGGFSEDQISGETFRTMRIFLGLGNSVPELIDPRVPIVPALLESADQLIVRGNRLATDAPGRTAIRQWVQKGGRLWIMLDSVEEETCQRLLGDACDFEYVDRVGLVNFQSKFSEGLSGPQNSTRFDLRSSNDGGIQEHEHPVEFVRVIVDDCETIATIDGWPSIFKKDFGQGTILFTTVGPRAFSRERQSGEYPRGMEGAVLLPRPELEIVAGVLFAKRNVSVVAGSKLEPLIERGIGYQVPGRGGGLDYLVWILPCPDVDWGLAGKNRKVGASNLDRACRSVIGHGPVDRHWQCDTTSD